MFFPFSFHSQDAGMSEIPIKVEKSRSSGMSEDFPSMSRGSPFDTERKMYDERHLNGHHSSSDSLNSKNSSESSKVHHIPIFIEGRDEPVSPMYRHETVEEEEPLSRTSSNASSFNGGRRSNLSNRSQSNMSNRSQSNMSNRSHSNLSNGNQLDRGEDHVTRSPSRDPESPIFRRGGRSIPITVESQAPFRQVRPGASQSTSSQNPATKTTKGSRTCPSTGPFVTKVPVRRCSPEEEEEEKTRRPEAAKVVKRPSPLEEIEEINCELSKLKQEVETFAGEYQDKQYRYLEEMLTRLLIRLDNVDSNGDVAVRTARKATVNAVEACASLLEAKGKRPVTVNCTDVDMTEDTPDTTTDTETGTRTDTGTPGSTVGETEASGEAYLDERSSDQKVESNEADVAMKEGREEVEEESRQDSQVSEPQEQKMIQQLVSQQQPVSDVTTTQEPCDEPMTEPTQSAQPIQSAEPTQSAQPVS